jgi:hypothetical protein
MMKAIRLATIPFLLLCFTFQLAFGQKGSEEEKFWKNKAKAYVKSPLTLKQEFEGYQNQITDLKKRNLDLVEKLNEAQKAQKTGGASQTTVDSLKWALVQKDGEILSAKREYEKLEKAYKSQRQVNDIGIKPGLVYRVQIGAFVFYEMEKPPVDAENFSHEKSDGFNKYLIGSFRTYAECDEFKDEIRKMGIKDAWVVPYIDGIRATIKEANDYLAKQGAGSIYSK